MVVELISVGTELLLGNIVNTNAAYLAEQCANLGLSLYYQTCVGDNEERMAEAFKTALERSDIVITTGGLGPTKDDITKEVAAKVLDMPLEEDVHSRQRIQAYLDDYLLSRPNLTLTSNNWKQALVPKGAIVLDNNNGTAPGLILEKHQKTMILLPGPPNELKPLFEEEVARYLSKKDSVIIYSKMIKICGIGESMAEEMIADLIEKQSNPTIAPYAKTGEVHIRVTAKAKNQKEAKELIKPIVRELKVRFGKNIYTTTEEKNLEGAIYELLKSQKLTLTTAESCTGGALSARLVNVPGMSEVFKQGFVTYSNKAKRRYLQVKKTTLKIHGAVSVKTAKEMAKGACQTTGSDVGIAITGIAGPDGGTKEKPVGLVYIACHFKETTKVNEYRFHGNRQKIREQSVVNALTLLRETILEHYNVK